MGRIMTHLKSVAIPEVGTAETQMEFPEVNLPMEYDALQSMINIARSNDLLVNVVRSFGRARLDGFTNLESSIIALQDNDL